MAAPARLGLERNGLILKRALALFARSVQFRHIRAVVRTTGARYRACPGEQPKRRRKQRLK
ncbi:hypothetical protein GGR25_001146 [Kaistia hirudinis]|uniref:Uncharacterized protein n=1 Tax=Kaistia hirudinis TaxID=1293440 RepID=A0A840AM49_9HYPH|nr:hypothetical protein [Kaistia hirudinis]